VRQRLWSLPCGIVTGSVGRVIWGAVVLRRLTFDPVVRIWGGTSAREWKNRLRG